MSATVFLFTPPFTQLNTPYPATAYLKGFLNTKNISSFQADLGIEATIAIFSKQGLIKLFERIETSYQPLSLVIANKSVIASKDVIVREAVIAIEAKQQRISENANRIITLKDDYIQTIDDVIHFLQGKNPTL